MDPLHPQVRAELKRAHPGLTDEDIDRYEELVALRFELDPETQADAIRKLDWEREILLRQTMPHYSEIVQSFTVAQPSRLRPSQQPRIEIKRRAVSDDDTPNEGKTSD